MTTTNTRFFHLTVTGSAYGRLSEAERYFLDGNLNEALAAAQQAWREHPQESDVFRVLAYIHMARGEYPPAAQAAYQSVLVDGENPASYAMLAQVYITFNMLKNAEETLTAARKQFLNDVPLLVLSADLHFRLRDYYTAKSLATQALSLNPDDAYAKALLGSYYLQKKWYADAEKMLVAAVEAYPQRWDYLRDLGICQLHTRNYDEAQENLEKAFRLNPADNSTKQHLAFALKFVQTDTPSRWRMPLYFYDHSVIGWILYVTGLLGVLVGALRILSQLHALLQPPVPGDVITAGAVSLAILLVGGCMSAFTRVGIFMHRRQGKKFDLQLWKAITGNGMNA